MSWLMNPDNLGRVVVNVLAIAGGFLIGWLLIGSVVSAGTRVLTGGKVPRWILFVMRALGGVAVAWLVALFVFGSGNWRGFGFGGDGGTGPGGGPAGTAKDPASANGTAPAVAAPPKEDKGPKPRGSTLRVEVIGLMGGSQVTDGRFYRFEGEKELRDRENLALAIDRIKQENPQVRELDIVVYENSPDSDTRAVRDLEQWARDNGLTPNRVLAAGKAP
jgi:hypothetical protein